MPTYDYICEAGHRVEKRRGIEVETIPCPLCGIKAHRAPFGQGGAIICKYGERPKGSYRRYQEASSEIDYTCKKFESETNATVPNLGLWETAKKEARRRGGK